MKSKRRSAGGEAEARVHISSEGQGWDGPTEADKISASLPRRGEPPPARKKSLPLHRPSSTASTFPHLRKTVTPHDSDIDSALCPVHKSPLNHLFILEILEKPPHPHRQPREPSTILPPWPLKPTSRISTSSSNPPYRSSPSSRLRSLKFTETPTRRPRNRSRKMANPQNPSMPSRWLATPPLLSARTPPRSPS